MDGGVDITGHQDIKHGINTLGNPFSIDIRHGGILGQSMKEFNDAKNGGKREGKIPPGLYLWGILYIPRLQTDMNRAKSETSRFARMIILLA
ncbi:hypothetical protein TUM17567_16790 [Citrobacter amalonaticus]|nr:hypothetical protein TUM17567_16790 [Citrobacter amalonaticus]